MIISCFVEKDTDLTRVSKTATDRSIVTGVTKCFHSTENRTFTHNISNCDCTLSCFSCFRTGFPATWKVRESQEKSGNRKMVRENVKYLAKVREIYKYLKKVRENVKKNLNDFKG